MRDDSEEAPLLDNKDDEEDDTGLIIKRLDGISFAFSEDF